MVTDVRLHVWILTTDDEGNYVRNMRDIKHVSVYTKECEWATPSLSTEDFKECILSSPPIDDVLNLVDVNVIKKNDIESLDSILKRFSWTYSKDNPVSFSLYIEPGSTKFGSERYKISESILDLLLKTFVGVKISMGGNTIQIPNVTYPHDLKSLFIENAIVECQDMIASFDSFDLINCELKHVVEGKPTFFNLTIHNHVEISRIKLTQPIYFQIMGKNENITNWQNISANVQFIEVLFSYEPPVLDHVFKFLNFASISFFELIINSNNSNITWLNIIDCVNVKIQSIQRMSTVRRNAYDIICKGCADISITNSVFKTILPNNETISEGKAAILFNKLDNAKINLSEIVVQNARLFMGASSIIDKITLDTITTTEDVKTIVTHASVIKNFFIVGTTIECFGMFSQFDVNRMKIKNSNIKSATDVTLHNIESFHIENSSLEQTTSLRIELTRTGKCDIVSSVCKAKSIQIIHPYISGEENKSSINIGDLSSVEGSLETKDIGKIIMNRCKLKLKFMKLHGVQCGESHFDIDSSYNVTGYDFEFEIMRNLNMTLIRSGKPVNIRCNNTKGKMNLKFRDPNDNSNNQNQYILLDLNESKLNIQFENEALISTSTVVFKSKNSKGTDISWSKEKRSDEAINMKIDPDSYDFNIMRRRTSDYKADHIVYG